MIICDTIENRLARVFFVVLPEKCLQFCTLFYFSLQICQLITVSGQTGAFVLAATRLAIPLVVDTEQETARISRLGHQSIANIVEGQICPWIHVSCLVCTTVRLYI